MTTPPATDGPYRPGWMLLVGIFALGVLVRGVFLWQVQTDPVYEFLVHDEGVNHQIAQAILAGEMPEASFYKAPLYMYVLAGIYRVLGEDPMRARWVQVVFDALSPVLLALIAGYLFGRAPAVLAGLLGAVFWTFVFYSAELVDTWLACLLYLLLAYLMLALPRDRLWTWLVCGVVLGLGAITRPNILAFAPVLFFTVLLVNGIRGRFRRLGEEVAPPEPWSMRWTRAVLCSLALTVGCCVAIAPVTLHNLLVGGERVLIATYGGLNFYAANSPWSDGKNGPLLVGPGAPDVSAYDPNNLWARLDLNYNIAKTLAQKHTGEPMTMAEVDRFFYAYTREYIREHPAKFLSDSFQRLIWFFNHYEFMNMKNIYRLRDSSQLLSALSWLHYGVWCPLAVLGVVLLAIRRDAARGLVFYAVMTLSLFLPGAFFVLNSRYRVPTVFLLVPFAAYGLARFVGLWRHPTAWSTRIGACAVVVGAAFLSNVNWFGYATTDHTELRLTYAMACFELGRDDLLAEATREFEEAYWAELEGDGHPWALTLQPTGPLKCLYWFHRRLGNAAEAKEYAIGAVLREPLGPKDVISIFAWLAESDLQAARNLHKRLVREGQHDKARVLSDIIASQRPPDGNAKPSP